MTTKNDFEEQEWSRIVRAPMLAGMAISLADPGGPIEAAKESMASLKAATNPPSREQLLADVALDLQGMIQQRHNPLKGYKPESGRAPDEQVLDELRSVCGLVAAKAEPEEAAAFGSWLLGSAQAAADAAKEGGFLGFRAEQVSEREKTMIDRIKDVVSG
jgi:hypothetical protein